MMPKIKNIMIFVGIAIVMVIIYVALIKKDPQEPSLVTSTKEDANVTNTTVSPNSQIAKDFLTLLLNVKSIHLDDAIFSDPAFNTLHDSSILLIPDGNEGRPNPFAPIGSDVVATPASALNASATSAGGVVPPANTGTTPPVTPPANTPATPPATPVTPPVTPPAKPAQ